MEQIPEHIKNVIELKGDNNYLEGPEHISRRGRKAATPGVLTQLSREVEIASSPIKYREWSNATATDEWEDLGVITETGSQLSLEEVNFLIRGKVPSGSQP